MNSVLHAARAGLRRGLIEYQLDLPLNRAITPRAQRGPLAACRSGQGRITTGGRTPYRAPS